MTYRMPAGRWEADSAAPASIGTLANLRASMSYVTGAHNMKFGYQGGFSNPTQHWTSVQRTHTRTAARPGAEPVDRERPRRTRRYLCPQPHPDVSLRPGSVDVRQADATGRSRYDHLLTSYPESTIEPTRLMPTGSTTPAVRHQASAGTTSVHGSAQRTTCSGTAKRL